MVVVMEHNNVLLSTPKNGQNFRFCVVCILSQIFKKQIKHKLFLWWNKNQGLVVLKGLTGQIIWNQEGLTKS